MEIDRSSDNAAGMAAGMAVVGMAVVGIEGMADVAEDIAEGNVLGTAHIVLGIR